MDIRRHQTNLEMPPDTCLLRYVPATPEELIGFNLVFVLPSTRYGALRICSVQLRQSKALWHKYTGLLFLADAAIQQNVAQSRKDVTHRNNNMTSGYFSK